MTHRYEGTTPPTELKPGDTEMEMGIAIPGVILPPESWTQTAIKRLPETGAVDWPAVFGNDHPLAIDIGCGNGRYTIASAVLRPSWNHVGADLLPAVIRYATRRGNQRGLANTRFIVCDGWKLLDRFLVADTVDEFHIYHPQPFAAADDASKRMLTPRFFLTLREKLKATGKIFLQTDRKSYWEYISQCCGTLFQWEEHPTAWPEEPLVRSRRELISADQGLPVFRGVATVRPDVSMEQLQELAEQLPAPTFAIDEAPRNHRHRHPRRRGSKR